ncbi:MAG: endolytic transglycosylase MltG [Alphaproteobacteria bacterium]|nr:endolytic transglycosylase MltG [Alphaproteobacteria bacterium]
MRLRTLIIVFLSLFVLAFAGGVMWANQYFRAPGPLPEAKTVLIYHGTSSAEMSRQLAEQGVITHPRVFHLVSRLIRGDRVLRAGEYNFATGVTPQEVFDALVEGKTVQRLVTFPEGLTSPQFMEILEKTGGLTGPVMDVPTGALMPETYGFSYGDTRQAIIDKMRKGMADTLAALWAARAPDLPLATPEEALVLASIVEKETGVPEERARVAAVFVNRLRNGMKLQTDPTVIYGITLGRRELGRALTRKDLETESPYNTYLHEGLPPSPICNPGRDSIEAALHPADTKDLYFVATGGGGHNFSESLAEHNQNVQEYRKLRDAPKAPVADKDAMPLK